MLVRVRSEFGTFRATDLDNDTARASDVVRALQEKHARVFHGQSIHLCFDAMYRKPVDPFKTLKDQQISNGDMLYGQVSAQWQCSTCTFLNRGVKKPESVCQVCQAPASGGTAAKRPLDNAEEESQPNHHPQSRKKPAVVRRRVTIGGFLMWDGSHDDSGETLDEFLHATRPSQVSSSECAWIAVENQVPESPGYCRSPREADWSTAPYQQALAKIESIIARGDRVKAADKTACVKEILRMATSQGAVVGKWMLFNPREKIDQVWETIAKATAEGRLGCSAKVAPSKELGDQRRALICVYVNDFNNKPEVKRVLQGIIGLGFYVASGFKPDVFTHLGIESGNQWRLDPTIYKPKDVLDNWDV